MKKIKLRHLDAIKESIAYEGGLLIKSDHPDHPWKYNSLLEVLDILSELKKEQGSDLGIARRLGDDGDL